MMKKVLIWIFVLMSSFSFVACSGAVTNYEFDADKPWALDAEAFSSFYEKATYTVRIVKRVKSGKTTVDGIELGNGTLVYELSSVGTDSVMLVSDLTVNYFDIEENGVNRGLTDSVKSEVRFLRGSVSVLYSEKTYQEAARRVSQEPNAEFMDTNSYSVVADYNAKTAVVKKGQAVDKSSGDVVDLNEYKSVNEFGLIDFDGRIFDNELLFYSIRALKTTVVSGGAKMDVSNIYEISSNIDKKGKYKCTPFAYSVNEELVPIQLDSSFAASFLEADDEGDYTVNCMQVVVAKNDSLPGTSFNLLITEPSVEFLHNTEVTRTNKVIVSIKTVQYDLINREEASNIVYDLTDYTNAR